MDDHGFLFVAVVALALVFVYQRFGKNEPFIEGMAFPRALHVPFIGVAQQVATLAGMERLYVDAIDADGLVSCRLMTVPCIAVTRADHVRQVFCATSYRDRIPVIESHIERLIGRKALPILMHDEWKVHRRLVSRAFHWQNLVKMVPAMTTVAETLASALLEKVDAVEVLSLLQLSALDTIGLLGFGCDLHALRDGSNPLANAFRFLLNETNRRCFQDALHPASHLMWLPTPANIRYRREAQIARSTIATLISHRVATHRTGGAAHHDLLEAMLDAAADDGDVMAPDLLADNVLTFFFAGADSTSMGMAYALYLLAAHPDVQAKTVAEIDAVLGREGEVTYDGLQKLPYTSAVLTEALRLYPPVATVYRNLVNDLPLGKYVIPGGTLVSLPLWFVNRSPLNWGPDANEFKPERHLEALDNDGMAAKDKAFRFMTFSGGPRNCVGMRFAVLEATIVLVSVLRKCVLTRPKGAPSVYPNKVGITLKPERGIWLHAVPRMA
ncbi:cytochrome P450 superfamily protein [Achlya hypogyna]|uniref:Cytochrome P450 superfamily protein n=1 Tax=Achlya hypogyna TaxID=1202772 RepID=A0A1V9ZDV6_ACHHY|nr:cytochrome P450 superfamily protein [Achlya hypogyna]